ncbi:MAG: colicin immunity domain-containing protein [Negativicutes bacterium]|nr:colicin immunity domain-containing protein [Negativicutes bacterium]
MTPQARRLIEICQAYLAGQLAADAYLDAFEQAFWDVQEDLEPEEFELLDAISLDNELYEPEDSVRAEESDLIDAAELRRRIQQHLENISLI